MPGLFKKAIIEKKNVLNEIRSNNMTVQELRFFSIYLSKINARDKSTRVVQFPMSDFRRIMEFGRLNMNQLQANTNSLLGKVVNIPNEDGGYTGFTLFKRCKVFKNELEEWFVEINASDDALPLMFELKNRYFSYELWNALRLKSPNQIRMYEILKQYEKIGKRELKIQELRELIGIKPNEYPRWDRFKVRVLDGCQKALQENTDICYTYERGKVGNGGKWLTVVFNIKKNESYVDQLTLYEFMDLQPLKPDIAEADEPDIAEADEPDIAEADEPDIAEADEPEEDLFSSAFENEFSKEEVESLLSVVRTISTNKLPILSFTDDIDLRRYHYLEQRYKAMLMYDKRSKIKNRFNYMLKIIKNDVVE